MSSGRDDGGTRWREELKRKEGKTRNKTATDTKKERERNCREIGGDGTRVRQDGEGFEY